MVAIIGKMLAIGCSDGTTKICDVNNGKVVQTLKPEDGTKTTVCCVGWVENQLSSSEAQTIMLSGPYKDLVPKGILDLELSSMLPRLSILPNIKEL